MILLFAGAVGAIAAVGAIVARTGIGRRAPSAPVRFELPAFPNATQIQSDLQRFGFALAGESEFVAADARTWRTSVFHHPRAGVITLTRLNDTLHVLRVIAAHSPTDREQATARMLEKWVPGVLDLVDGLKSAPYDGRLVSVIGRRRFYMWLTLGPLDSTTETQRMQLELRTPIGQETLIENRRSERSSSGPGGDIIE